MSINPTHYILETGAPFNFGMTTDDWDKLWHRADVSISFKPVKDPCLWFDEEKQEVNKRAEKEFLDYQQWCKNSG